MITCHLCGSGCVDMDEVLDHIRDDHPEDWEPLERWPDGSLVVVDNTLTPDDFWETE